MNYFFINYGKKNFPHNVLILYEVILKIHFLMIFCMPNSSTQGLIIPIICRVEILQILCLPKAYMLCHNRAQTLQYKAHMRRAVAAQCYSQLPLLPAIADSIMSTSDHRCEIFICERLPKSDDVHNRRIIT